MRIIIKTLDGKIGFSEYQKATTIDDLPLTIVTEDNRTFDFRDWAGQFGGDSIPVYEEQVNETK